jgi:undecaprenyl diphosphate synthase
MPRLLGHRAGVEAARRVVRACGERGVKVVTLYAFSTENWQRPPEEIDGLMSILAQSIDKEVGELLRSNVQLRHIGTLDRLSTGLRDKIHRAIEATQQCTGLVVCVALNYGGRAEIVEAAKALARSKVAPESIDEHLFCQYLYTKGLPDPDLIVRTAGEMRLSNFLVWQAAYAEFYSTPTYWPDFDAMHLEAAFQEYSNRTRKFGRVVEVTD